jgi:hypothetical protein
LAYPAPPTIWVRKTRSLEITMRMIALTAVAVALAAAISTPVQAQKVPVWNMMRDPLVIPRCEAPRVLTEIRHANGRISWRCVAPKKR